MNYYRVKLYKDKCMVGDIEIEYPYYKSNSELSSGERVIVPVGENNCLGIVYDKVDKPLFKVREVLFTNIERLIDIDMYKEMKSTFAIEGIQLSTDEMIYQYLKKGETND